MPLHDREIQFEVVSNTWCGMDQYSKPNVCIIRLASRHQSSRDSFLLCCVKGWGVPLEHLQHFPFKSYIICSASNRYEHTAPIALRTVSVCHRQCSQLMSTSGVSVIPYGHHKHEEITSGNSRLYKRENAVQIRRNFRLRRRHPLMPKVPNSKLPSTRRLLNSS